jgi:hypothetical protein
MKRARKRNVLRAAVVAVDTAEVVAAAVAIAAAVEVAAAVAIAVIVATAATVGKPFFFSLLICSLLWAAHLKHAFLLRPFRDRKRKTSASVRVPAHSFKIHNPLQISLASLWSSVYYPAELPESSPEQRSRPPGLTGFGSTPRSEWQTATLRELTCLIQQAKKILRSSQPGVYEMNSASAAGSVEGTDRA